MQTFNYLKEIESFIFKKLPGENNENVYDECFENKLANKKNAIIFLYILLTQSIISIYNT